MGDASRLAQLLDNLISNAVKFTPRGRQCRDQCRRLGRRRGRGSRHWHRYRRSRPGAPLHAVLQDRRRDEGVDPGDRPRPRDQQGHRRRTRGIDLRDERRRRRDDASGRAAASAKRPRAHRLVDSARPARAPRLCRRDSAARTSSARGSRSRCTSSSGRGSPRALRSAPSSSRRQLLESRSQSRFVGERPSGSVSRASRMRSRAGCRRPCLHVALRGGASRLDSGAGCRRCGAAPISPSARRSAGRIRDAAARGQLADG